MPYRRSKSAISSFDPLAALHCCEINANMLQRLDIRDATPAAATYSAANLLKFEELPPG